MNALLKSSEFVTYNKPLSSTALPDRSYVLSIAALPAQYAVATSAPSNKIHLLDRADCKTVIQTMDGHEGGLSYMCKAESLAGRQDVLVSCGKDASVKAWDERTGKVSVHMLSSGRRPALLSCDVSSEGLMVAAGTVIQGEDAAILYWDPRNPAAPLRRHASTHSDDITAVQFARSGSAEILLSASTDGLICTSNPLEVDEDEAGINVGNWGCSVSKAGWIREDTHQGRPKIWASSDMETLSIWDDELDLLQDLDRGRLAHTDISVPWVTDYIIDGRSASNGSFHLFAGSNEGDIALISRPTTFATDSRWTLEQLFTTGHSEVVRCALWDKSSEILLTGGEDSKLNVWRCSAQGEDMVSEPMDIDVLPRKRVGNTDQNSPKRVRTL